MSDDLKPCPFCGGPASVFRLRTWAVPSVRCQNNCTDETDIEEWSARPIEDDLRARAEAAEARAAQAEAAGYRRAVDDVCAALGKRAGFLRNFDVAVEIVRALAPAEPVSPADELPGDDR